jgi:hypothetical protein
VEQDHRVLLDVMQLVADEGKGEVFERGDEERPISVILWGKDMHDDREGGIMMALEESPDFVDQRGNAVGE